MKKAIDITGKLLKIDWKIGKIRYPFSITTNVFNCKHRKDGCENNCLCYNAGLKMLREKIEARTSLKRGSLNTIIETPGKIEFRLHKPLKEDTCYIDILFQKEGIFTPEDVQEFNVLVGKLGNSVIDKVRRTFRKDK